jgi:hypothetical protein
LAVPRPKSRELVQLKPKRKPYGPLQVINNSLKMLKRIVEMQNISRNVQKINSATVVKVMLLFWLALLVQMKFNKSARKTVIKTLYVMGGMVTVLGLVGTTGILIYKHRSTKRKNSELSEEGDS